MPFVEVKTIRGVFSEEEKPRIIEEVTKVFARMRNQAFAQGTWVVINEIGNGDWGEGGSVLKAEEVPREDSPEK